MLRTSHAILLFAAVTALLGCDRGDEIRVYSAPKDHRPAPSPVQLDDQPPPTTAPFDGVDWKAPPGWVLDAPKPMRVASYRASNEPGAPELIITRFAANNIGTMIDNINRWRGFAGLDPIRDESEQPVEQITVGNSAARLFVMKGTEKHLLVAMVPAGQDIWFFRFTGPADAVARERANFDTFLKSVQFK